jgi:hypothetical protein
MDTTPFRDYLSSIQINMPEETNMDPQNEVTQTEGEVSTPTSEGATGTQRAPSSEQSDQTDPSQEIDYKTRYSESSKEARKLYEEKKKLEEEVEAIRENTLKFVTSDRQTFQNYLDSQGFTADEKERFLSSYDEANPAQPQGQPQGAQPPPQPQMDPYQQRALDEAAGRLRSQVESRQKATQRFLESEENSELSQETLGAIWPLAFKLETENRLDPDEALNRAREIVVDQSSVEDRSYAQGLNDALLGSTSSGVSGGSRGSKTRTELPPRHEKFVQDHIAREGLTGKAAEEFRNGYAQRLAVKNLI